METAVLKHILVPINKAGWPFVGGALALSVAFALIWKPLAIVGLIIAAFCTYFFRDPERQTPVREGLVVSPADGHVSAVETAVPPAELNMGTEPMMRVSVFLSVFDVHVNRVPTAGKITELAYHHGAFLNAALDKASELNERMSVKMETNDGKEIAFVQIAGLIARRIICNLTLDQEVKTGERFGLIRFGSRTDIYLPDGIAPLVSVGQQMIGGETVIADLLSDETQRETEVR
ncbi:phosphatidylserine decarboxylase [Kiloniella spongiae]|uniref:Phosphatidylserine decarboxylase proenzyme n=1 Tax=Kiloniella spongiae TaxID=1489064 RepID=A0A0H2MCH8_9PROT|nr:phosphatidylserine decarboxylase [Kiloniella spongiae]KLN60274.1 phosphatidylserine decarboxylase [Kiloniella spongiae]